MKRLHGDSRKWSYSAVARSVASLVALVLMASAVAATSDPVAPAPTPGSLFLMPERFFLEDGSLGTAQRGLLFVPQNRSVPESDVLSVEIYRFAATEEAASAALPIFVLHGGPGFTGLEPRLEDPGFFESRIEPLTRLGDVVVVGQRGIGTSRPSTVCASSGGAPAAMGQACKEYWSKAGVDLQGFTVIEAAADVRDVAKALGYQQIVIQGGSFGSHWGMAVMRYHPEIVARAVLTGMEGSDHTYDMPSWVLNSIRRMAKAADSSERLRGHIPEGGLIASFERVLDELRKRPATATATDPETGADTEMKFFLPQVREMLFGYSGRISSRSGMVSWPADIIALAQGDFSRAARVRLERRARSRSASEETRSTMGLRTASFFMLDCGSGISEARLKTLDEDPAIPVIGNLGFFYKAACVAWDADLGEEFRSGFVTDIPTAIVHGNWDTSTPYENALELLPSFSNGKLVTVDGGSHGALAEALQESESFRDALDDFIRTGDLSGLPETVVLPEIEWELPGGKP